MTKLFISLYLWLRGVSAAFLDQATSSCGAEGGVSPTQSARLLLKQ